MDLAAGVIENSLDLKEIFYSNLLLLGFDPEGQEAKSRIPFNSDMFLHPNKKAMEIVLHFLFCNLDAPLAFQEFRDCWPVRDKKMEQQFRKSCNSWLTKISKEEPDSNMPRVGPTLFLSPGGERFYEMMFYFSSYVLRKVMVRDYGHGKESVVPHMCKKIARMPNMNSISSKAMLVKMLAEKNRFFENVQRDVEVQEHWKSHAMSSTKEYRKLCKENRELERKLHPTGTNVYMKERTGCVEETETLRRTKQLHEVREHWSVLETFHKNTAEKRTILNEILENNDPNFQLDGSCIQLQIPDVLTTKYRHAIQMKNIKNTYEGGKLNMLSLVQLSTLSLHEMKEKIRQDGVPDFEQFIPHVKHEVRTHGTYLAQAQNLRASLKNELIPELKKSIDDLKEECYSILDEPVNSPVVSLESFEFGLGLLPATPSPAFTTSGQLTQSAGRMPDISLKKTPRNQATPDVIEDLTSSVREMVIKDRKETSRPFVSKIPKPVNCPLSQTPDVNTKKPTAVRRRSLTTTKKLKRTRGDGIRMEKVDTKKESTSPRVTGVKKGVHLGKKSDKTSNIDVEQFQTPLTTGTKSVFVTQHSSARNILAEKIAAAVFSAEPSSRVESSQSSSGENTPKDLAIADPLGNLMEEPFISKDLIPRTPFKSNEFLSDGSENDTPGRGGKSSPRSTETQRTNHNVASTNIHTSTQVSSDVILKYQQLKQAQEELGNEVNVLLKTPKTSTCLTLGSSDTMVQDNEVGHPVLQFSCCSYTTTLSHSACKNTTNPVLLRYQQWKKDQEMAESSAAAITHPDVTELSLVNYQVGSEGNDDLHPSSVTNITSRSRSSLAAKFTSSNPNPGNQGNADLTSPRLQSPELQADDLLTPLVKGNHGLSLEHTSVADDITYSGQPATHVTYSKGFTTPMMFGTIHDLEQTPLEYIKPPMDFNSNTFNQERRESVRSRLSFDFVTPISSAQNAYLRTPTAREIANLKVDNVTAQRKFDLIPVNMEDFLREDYQLPTEENTGDFKKHIERNVVKEQGNSSIENTATTEVCVDLTPHVEVGQLIDFD